MVGTKTLGAPLHEHEVGKGPHEMRVWGRIVRVRSTEQSVFNQNVTFGVRIIISKKTVVADPDDRKEKRYGDMGKG